MKLVLCLVFAFAQCGLLLPLAAQQDVIISEFMADNASSLADVDGQFSDWIEIHNPTENPISLEGYYLTDDPGLLTKWEFPAVTLPAGGYLVVFASGKNRATAGAELHANFQLDAGGEYLALVQPDGSTLASAFSPSYPPQKEDVAYGVAQTRINASLVGGSPPRILVPGSAAELPPNWNALEYQPDASWMVGSAPAALGFDTEQPVPVPSNLAPGGTAVQSTTVANFAANLATDNNLANFSQTLGTDNAPFWQVTLASEATLYQIVLHNRDSCCGSRLRDITVEILAADGVTTNFVSPLLNPENAGYTYPAGPDTIDLDLESLAGGAVIGQIVRVRRTPDLDLSGTNGQGDAEEAASLALGEVQVLGVPAATQVNLARTGSPLPTATQSTTLSGYPAGNGINGNLGDFTHTQGTDANATWTLDLGRSALINHITLHNRDSCCGSRLRDITVEILDTDGSTALYSSPLLNPENAGFTFPNGPDSLELDLTGQSVVGQFVRVRRAPDSDLSGTGGQGNADESNVLSLGEVIVLGVDVNGYRPFIRTDLQSRMLGQNASAFVRLPFTVADPSILNNLDLNLRYDDGFVAYLNGVEVVRRNAPASLAWDASAPSDREVAQVLALESIELDSALLLLQTGSNVLAFHALNSSPTDGNFLLQPELASSYVERSGPAYLVDATPGFQNDTEPFYGDVADTRFSVDRGFFEEPFQVEIFSDTPGAAIYYSFDGSEPDSRKGLLYTGPITITNTTILRARAFKPGLRPTDVDTQTYLFLADVIYQAPTGQPPPYFPASWGNNRVDYGMDPNVVSKYSPQQWREALTQIPSISVVTEMPNLFDPATGIYANALQHGIDWERPSSIELLDPDHPTPGRFQENCGLRIRGGYSRNPEFVKHSLRIFFRREYGAPKLHYPLFEDQGADEFDTFDLRTSQNYAWPRETSAGNGRHDTMVREVFCRETLGAMGQPYRRSRYYHLYLNGQYWGLYETDERPEASYGATYFGGNKDDYDVVKCANHVGGFVTEVTDGNFLAWTNLWVAVGSLATDPGNANYFRILGCNPDGSRNPNLRVMLDVDNLIDYMLGIFYSGDGDATLSAFLSNTRPNNWFGMANRNNPNMGFRFFNSDCEHTLGAPSWQTDRTGPFGNLGGSNIRNFTYSNPQYFHEDLMRNAEYRLRFADHVRKHFFDGGALTAEAGTNRFIRKAVQITKAIRPYSARWGDGAPHEPPYGETEWTNIIQEILTTWFPTRTGVVLGQLKADGLYPDLNAPSFSLYGGEITEGFPLVITHNNAAGTIYYTLDGSDPRRVGGLVGATAVAYAGPVTLNISTRVKARVLNGSTWSALTEADFAVPALALLRVTEIMYHPAEPSPAEITAGYDNADDFEYIELRNVGPIAINLAGARFVDGISFTFHSGVLQPGQRVLLAKNQAAFTLRYGTSANLAGAFDGNLNNAGERLRLEDALGRLLLDFSYSDNWFPVTDGFGFSLVIKDDSAPPASWNNKASWSQSATLQGNPGADKPAPPVFPLVVINEILSRPGPAQPVSIEIANLGQTEADLSGWWLSDEFRVPGKHQLPANSIVPAGGFLVLTENEFGPSGLTFLTSGSEAALFSANALGTLTGYYQGWDFGAADEGVSFGRHVTSTGADHLVAQQAVTLGSPNAGPRVGPVVITELMYRPPDLGPFDNIGDEFIELLNITDQPVPLYDPAAPANPWILAGAVDFAFPAGLELAPGEFALVVAFNPTLNPAWAADFRARYNIPPEVRLFGPYSGNLSNGGDDVDLYRPTLLPTGQPDDVRIERIAYQDDVPWPAGADGYGLSLHRQIPSSYGNDPANWIALAPQAGRPLTTSGTAPTITQQPVGLTQPSGQSFLLSVAATGTGPLHYQWRLNGSSIPGATSATYGVVNTSPEQSGEYRVLVYNNAGSVVSLPATVYILPPPQILSHPADVTVYPSNNVSFSVQAVGFEPLSYQWQFHGTDIPGATSPTLVVTNVQFHVHDGLYTVTVTDEGGTSVSQPARLTILSRPVFILQPLSVTVPQGGTAVFSVQADGTLPMGYRWRKLFATVKLEVLDDYTSFLVLTNVQPSDAGNYTVVITNAAFYTPGVLSTNIATLTVLADTDQDGIPDEFETNHQLNPNDPTDAHLDADGDGVSNGDEYQAGTDLADPQSYLKVDIQFDGTAQLLFPARSGLTYSVLYKNALDDPVWLLLGHVPARPTDHTPVLIDDQAGLAPQRYYRLVTPAQP